MPAANRDLTLPRARPLLSTASANRLIGLLANDWALAGVIFLFTRAVALIGAYNGVRGIIAAEPARNKGWLAELVLMWDAAWYVGIAKDHYTWDPAAPGGTNVAFAPLYPFLMRFLATVLQWLTFGWNWGNSTYGVFIAAGLIISNLAFLAALVFLLKLLSPRVGRYGASIVALALASFPTAFFFSGLYTEGLFLFLALGSFLVARTDWRYKWLCVGALGLMASLCRFGGALLLPALGVEYMAQRGWRWRKVRADALWLLLIPSGIAIYMGFLWWRFGNPLALNDTMLKGWNHQTSFFVTTYWNSVVQLWQSVTGAVTPDHDPVLYYGNGSRLYLVLDLALPLLLIIGAVIARKKLLASEWVWLALGVIYPLSTNITFSMSRYILPLWPGLIWLGTMRGSKRSIAVAAITLSLVLMAWCSSIYGGARWIG